MRIHKDSQDFKRGFARLWERIQARIRETLGEDLQDFGRGFEMRTLGEDS